MRDIDWRDIDWAEAVIFGGIILFIIAIVFLNVCCQNNKYNNGVHKGCGGHLIYQQAIGHRYSTSYIFKCDKCGEIMEFGSLAVDGKEMYFEETGGADGI